MKLQMLGTVLAITLCAPALAQTPNERPFGFHVGAGFSATTGTADRYLDDGWIVSGGVDWHPNPDLPLTLSLDAHYSDYDATNELINLGTVATRTRIDDGDGSTLGADVNATYGVPLGSRLRGYIVAGAGIDRRRIELTQTVLFNGFVCDPFWGFCGIGAVPGDVIVARNSTTRFAWNAGLGLELPVGNGAWFFDARFRRIETTRPTEYVPIQIGYRF
ncbi:MAG TPA: outer membrane beta-barrel protein [Steroidobacteraceae bacterium]|nr:outer membrane beta-barrel protein [Steroidobacteraceae bacterium]